MTTESDLAYLAEQPPEVLRHLVMIAEAAETMTEVEKVGVEMATFQAVDAIPAEHRAEHPGYPAMLVGLGRIAGAAAAAAGQRSLQSLLAGAVREEPIS